MTESKIRVPHTLVLLFGMILVAWVATYILQPGSFERVTNEVGREQVVPGSFQPIEGAESVSLWQVFKSIPQGFEAVDARMSASSAGLTAACNSGRSRNQRKNPTAQTKPGTENTTNTRRQLMPPSSNHPVSATATAPPTDMKLANIPHASARPPRGNQCESELTEHGNKPACATPKSDSPAGPTTASVRHPKRSRMSARPMR